ncbi:MAG: maleylpyruvate isomerase N-terminal domain-containing protein [Actinobacteria bacterium]|nr:maleylpyruvate isomerase N-terminal domain-containing protein [Actinomycetota bacterium]
MADADAIVCALDVDRWDTPSRCVGWSVGDLVAHMVGQNVGFAQAISTAIRISDPDLDTPAQRTATPARRRRAITLRCHRGNA